jgi:thiosulfate/3-mercaptopyruvate sulfurtransferase
MASSTLRVAVFLASSFTALAQGLPNTMLVSTEHLASQLGQDSLVVLHVGSAKDYDAGHIPGARLITLADISITGARDLRLEVPPAEALLSALGKLGISKGSRVVIYTGTDAVQPATRVWFTFDYLGMGESASLLDGGLAAWRAEGRPITTDPSKWQPATLTASPRPELVVDAAYVQAHLRNESIRIVDARTEEFFSGASPGSMPRAGRIPGAQHAPFPSFFNESRKLRSRDELARLLPVPTNTTPVTYCHIGLQATVPYFVARYLGMQPRLYDGSFQDWSARTELPIEVGAAK